MIIVNGSGDGINVGVDGGDDGSGKPSPSGGNALAKSNSSGRWYHVPAHSQFHDTEPMDDNRTARDSGWNLHIEGREDLTLHLTSPDDCVLIYPALGGMLTAVVLPRGGHVIDEDLPDRARDSPKQEDPRTWRRDRRWARANN